MKRSIGKDAKRPPKNPIEEWTRYSANEFGCMMLQIQHEIKAVSSHRRQRSAARVADARRMRVEQHRNLSKSTPEALMKAMQLAITSITGNEPNVNDMASGITAFEWGTSAIGGHIDAERKRPTCTTPPGASAPSLSPESWAIVIETLRKVNSLLP